MQRRTLATTLATALALIVGACGQTPPPAQPVAHNDPVVAPAPEPDPAPAVDLVAVRDALAARRQVNLDRLLAYANAGVFPLNRHSDGPLNVMIDEDGHICAAANLIALDGHEDLVRAMAAKNNFVVLRDVHSGPIYDWMMTSGFTQEEIAMIQEPYMPIVEEPAPEPNQPPVIAQDWATKERARLQGVLRGVHSVLVANSDKSLGLAMQRLEAQPALMASFATATGARVAAR